MNIAELTRIARCAASIVMDLSAERVRVVLHESSATATISYEGGLSAEQAALLKTLVSRHVPVWMLVQVEGGSD